MICCWFIDSRFVKYGLKGLVRRYRHRPGHLYCIERMGWANEWADGRNNEIFDAATTSLFYIVFSCDCVVSFELLTQCPRVAGVPLK